MLVTAAAYFAATFLGQQMKLRILTDKLLVISQRFFGIPHFRFYAWQMEFAVFSPAAPSSRRRNCLQTRNSNSPSSGRPEKFWGKS